MARRTREVGGHRGRYTTAELRAMVGESWARDIARDRRRGRQVQPSPKIVHPEPEPGPAPAPQEAPPKPAAGASPILARISSVSAHYMPARRR